MRLVRTLREAAGDQEAVGFGQLVPLQPEHPARLNPSGASPSRSSSRRSLYFMRARRRIGRHAASSDEFAHPAQVTSRRSSGTKTTNTHGRSFMALPATKRTRFAAVI